MVGLSALWVPILVSAVFVFITLMLSHLMPGWHKGDMTALPGEDTVMETLRGLNVQPGEYRFPYGNTTKEMEAPAFVEKMKAGPVLLLCGGALAELDLVGQEHAIDAHILGGRSRVRARDGCDVRLAVA